MGQYFLIVNLDREEYLHPHKFGEGLKLFEFNGLTMEALKVLITHEADGYFDQGSELLGAWTGQRVVIAGDAADQAGNYLSNEQSSRLREALLTHPGPRPPRLPDSAHLFARRCCRDISEEILLAMCHCRDLQDLIAEVAGRRSDGFVDEAYRVKVLRELEIAGYGRKD